MTQRRAYRDRVVAITGAAGGLGSAMARAWGAAGATIVALDVDGDRAQALAATLRAQRIEAVGLACDVADATACRATIDEAIRLHGGIDVLVANAGISARCLLRDTAPGVVERVMAVNFLGAVHATQAALASLRARSGQIVAISSVAGFAPLVGRTAYAASKHALHGFFGSLRGELARDGVDVTLVCPSFIATGIERAALGADGRPAAAPRRTTGGEQSADEVAARIIAAAGRGARLCLPSRTARLAWWVSRIASARYERLMLARVGAEFEL